MFRHVQKIIFKEFEVSKFIIIYFIFRQPANLKIKLFGKYIFIKISFNSFQFTKKKTNPSIF